MTTERKRYTIIIGAEHQEKLARMATDNAISQADVIEVLVEQADEAKLKKVFAAKKESKVETRGRKKDLVKAINALTPEEKAAILEQLQG
jgi:Spy/CpxP family protein refolding chaperone